MTIDYRVPLRTFLLKVIKKMIVRNDRTYLLPAQARLAEDSEPYPEESVWLIEFRRERVAASLQENIPLVFGSFTKDSMDESKYLYALHKSRVFGLYNKLLDMEESGIEEYMKVAIRCRILQAFIVGSFRHMADTIELTTSKYSSAVCNSTADTSLKKDLQRWREIVDWSDSELKAFQASPPVSREVLKKKRGVVKSMMRESSILEKENERLSINRNYTKKESISYIEILLLSVFPILHIVMNIYLPQFLFNVLRENIRQKLTSLVVAFYNTMMILLVSKKMLM
jgi:hypothetical protein